MAIYLEDYIPVVKYQGLNTKKDVKNDGINEVALTALRVIGFGTTTTDLDAQSGTAAIAELLGGIYTHNSKTGAGTITTPTGTQMSAGITNVGVGYTFQVVYYNRGNQTVTVTAGASGATILGTAAVPTLKTAILTFVCTGVNAWNVYVTLSA